MLLATNLIATLLLRIPRTPGFHVRCQVPLPILQLMILKLRFQIFKEVGAKFSDLFLRTEWLQRNFSHPAIFLPLDFSAIVDIFRIGVFSFFVGNSRKNFQKKLKPP